MDGTYAAGIANQTIEVLGELGIMGVSWNEVVLAAVRSLPEG